MMLQNISKWAFIVENNVVTELNDEVSETQILPAAAAMKALKLWPRQHQMDRRRKD